MNGRVLKLYVFALAFLLTVPALAADVDVPKADWGLEEVGLESPAVAQEIELVHVTSVGEAQGPPVNLLRAVRFGMLAIATSGDGVNLLAITGAR